MCFAKSLKLPKSVKYKKENINHLNRWFPLGERKHFFIAKSFGGILIQFFFYKKTHNFSFTMYIYFNTNNEIYKYIGNTKHIYINFYAKVCL